MNSTNITLSALAALLSGCAAAQPSAELLDARSSMHAAETGHAADYAPGKLNDARELLDEAERQEDGSTEEVHLAYLAHRTADGAAAHGGALYYVAQAERVDARYHALQESGRIEAEEKLATLKRELSSIESKMQKKDADLETLGARKRELVADQQRMASALSDSNSALVASEKARAAAEERAAAAIASLSTLANVKEEANRTVVTLSGSVLFETGKSALLPLAEDSLARVAEALKELPPERTIVIEGHTDSRGDDASNEKLSQARSESVMQYLRSQGVDSGKMTAVGRGESKPVASNETAEGRANNRRVELIIRK